jgi:hypothetical protein
MAARDVSVRVIAGDHPSLPVAARTCGIER